MTHLTEAQLAAASTAPEVDRNLLGVYLGDHLTGSTAGVSRLQDMAERFADEPFGAEIAVVADQVAAERATLEAVIEALELDKHPVRQALAWVGERVGSLKPNGQLIGESPMTPVLELELTRGAVMAKGAGWEVLSAYAPRLGLPREVFDTLAQQSRDQVATLARAHTAAAATAFLTAEEAD